jgi:hypothetical protein
VLTKDSPKEAMLKGFRKRFMGNADYISKVIVDLYITLTNSFLDILMKLIF